MECDSIDQYTSMICWADKNTLISVARSTVRKLTFDMMNKRCDEEILVPDIFSPYVSCSEDGKVFVIGSISFTITVLIFDLQNGDSQTWTPNRVGSSLDMYVLSLNSQYIVISGSTRRFVYKRDRSFLSETVYDDTRSLSGTYLSDNNILYISLFSEILLENLLTNTTGVIKNRGYASVSGIPEGKVFITNQFKTQVDVYSKVGQFLYPLQMGNRQLQLISSIAAYGSNNGESYLALLTTKPSISIFTLHT